MRHLKKGRKLNRTNSHRSAMISNLASSLVFHKRIRTTLPKVFISDILINIAGT